MGRVVHFEIPADNTGSIIKFYTNVFGWQFEKWGDQDYWIILTGEGEVEGINGGLMKRREPQQPMVNTIDVPDLNVVAEKIVANGGTIVVPRMAIPSVGWLIYFKDVEGNIFGCMQSDENAK